MPQPNISINSIERHYFIKFAVVIGALTQAVNCFQCTYYDEAIPSLSAVNCSCHEDSIKGIVSLKTTYLHINVV